MSKENQTTSMNKKDLAQFIHETVESTINSQQAPRIQAVKETSLLHYLNLLGKGRDFLRASVDLGLAVVDAGLAIPASLIKSEIVVPSLNCDSIEKWLREEKQKEEDVVVLDK